MRVLFSAFTCVPGSGSEPGAGWIWVAAAAAHHECTLLTRSSEVPLIREALRSEPQLSVEVVAVDFPRLLTTSKGRLIRLQHAVWQARVRTRARQLHAQAPYDVTHHLTISADWQPVGLAGVDGPAFVWGPIGGVGSTPWRLVRYLGVTGTGFGLARQLMSSVGRRTFGGRALARASLVLCQNSEVADYFGGEGTAVVEPHIGIATAWHAPADPSNVKALFPGDARTAVFVGRLLTWKGLALALEALARPEAAEWRLVIVGTGADEKRLRRRAAKLGLGSRVDFVGGLDRAELPAVFDAADALLFPSFHEAAGWVVAEALARGCPVIALDRGGPATLVPLGGGTLIPVGPDMPAAFARALAATRSRVEPVTRWDAERLPAMIDDFYGTAVQAHRAGHMEPA